MPWSVDDALNRLWFGFDKNGTDSEIRAYLQTHLTAAFNSGRDQEADAWRTSVRLKQENAVDGMTEIDKRIASLRRIVGHDSHIDTSPRSGKPFGQVIYGDEAKRALAEIDQLCAASPKCPVPNTPETLYVTLKQVDMADVPLATRRKSAIVEASKPRTRRR